MKIYSSGISNGIIDKKYGKFGFQFNAAGCTYSLPLEISDYPKDTKTFALVLEDKDAYPLTGGFVWYHWLAANILTPVIPENVSIAAPFVQGINSSMSIQGGKHDKLISGVYCGMAPPDAPHLYELTIYALDDILPLSNGFYLNELHKKMDGHILEQATLKALYLDK